MKEIYVVRELTGAGGESVYVPVPCKGIVRSTRIVSDLQMDATGTLVVSRGATAVNTVTVPAGNIAAGITLDGVPDATNKDLIFDPDSATAANRVIKITDDATLLSGAATVTILIKYDEYAKVAQAPLEA